MISRICQYQKRRFSIFFHTSFRQILPLTASKILFIRQYVRGSFLVTGKIMLENPHTISMRTGSKIFPEL